MPKRPRDNTRKNVYWVEDWVDELVPPRVIPTDQVQSLVSFASLMHPEGIWLRWGPADGTKAWGGKTEGGTTRVFLPDNEWGHRASVVLHEIAHCLADESEAWHGRSWMRHYMELQRDHLPERAGVWSTAARVMGLDDE